jgi:hypothetical protein
VHLVGFIIKKFVTMHANMNVKLMLSLRIGHIGILKFLFLSDVPKKMLFRFLIYPRACYMPLLLNNFFLYPCVTWKCCTVRGRGIRHSTCGIKYGSESRRCGKLVRGSYQNVGSVEIS